MGSGEKQLVGWVDGGLLSREERDIVVVSGPGVLHAQGQSLCIRFCAQGFAATVPRVRNDIQPDLEISLTRTESFVI